MNSAIGYSEGAEVPEDKTDNLRRIERDLLAKFPMSKELIMYDANARTFFMCLLRGDDPYLVMDQMILHYTKIKNEYFELLNLLKNKPI